MPKTVDYGVAVAILQINGKFKEEWQQRDPELDLPGSNSRLVVRDASHAKMLSESCAKIWAEYEQKNLVRGNKRGRKPGSGFRSLMDELAKVVESNPEPKTYSSSDVAAELEARTQESKNTREDDREAKQKRRRRPKGDLDCFKQETHQNFDGLNLRIPLTVDYGEWTSGECAYTVRVNGEIAMFGDGDTKQEAWSMLCEDMKQKLTDLESGTNEATDDAILMWLLGLSEEDVVPDCFRDQWMAVHK